MCARWAACLMTLRRRLAILMIRGRAHSSLNWSSAYELRRAKEEVDHFVEHTMPTCANVRQCSQMCRSCAKCKGRDVGMGKLWHARRLAVLQLARDLAIADSQFKAAPQNGERVFHRM